jgi:hypothetical protein
MTTGDVKPAQDGAPLGKDPAARDAARCRQQLRRAGHRAEIFDGPPHPQRLAVHP